MKALQSWTESMRVHLWKNCIVLPGVFFTVISCECQSPPLLVTAQHPADPDLSTPCLDSVLPQQECTKAKVFLLASEQVLKFLCVRICLP